MNLEIKVTPGCKNDSVKKISEKKYKISLKEKAEDNKANIALLKLLKKHFNQDFKIIRGLRSKTKLVGEA